MKQRDALRLMRSEIGMTQSELANELNVSFSTVNRWENQDARPNKAISVAILALAKRRSVSAACLNELTCILLASRVDDRADKEKIAQITERMKLEERVLLTDYQMKTMLDNMDLAVIGHRVFAATPGEATLFYFNRRYVEIFGYSEAEVMQKSRRNLLFAISEESREEFQTHLERLLEGKTDIADSRLTIKCTKYGGEELWLEIKCISLNRFSYGWELFTSCRDVTKSVLAQRSYEVEVGVGNASLKGYYASLFCDLETNKIFRQRDIKKVIGRELNSGTVDDVLMLLAHFTPVGAGRDSVKQNFSRDELLRACERGDSFGSVTVFNTVARRYLRVDHVILINPYTKHVEAAIYIYDIHDQVLSNRLMNIFAADLFEFIGAIDTESGSFEAYFYSQAAFKDEVQGKRDYAAICEEKLRRYAEPDEYDEQRKAISLETVRERLKRAKFYSTFLCLKDYDGRLRQKKVTFTYLDDTHSMIAVAQSDTADIAKTVSGGSDLPGSTKELRLVK